MVILALIPDNPHRTPATPLVLADTPDPEPAAINDVIQHDEGGGVMQLQLDYRYKS
jgi:hypothetical protein